MSEIKAHYSPFLNVLIWAVGKEEKDVLKIKCRLAPNSISCYYEAFQNIEGEAEPRRITYVICGSGFKVDLPIEEFDELMQTVERGMSFEDDNLKN